MARNRRQRRNAARKGGAKPKTEEKSLQKDAPADTSPVDERSPELASRPEQTPKSGLSTGWIVLSGITLLGFCIAVSQLAGSNAGTKAANEAVDYNGLKDRLSNEVEHIKRQIDVHKEESIGDLKNSISSFSSSFNERLDSLQKTLSCLDIPREEPPLAYRNKAVFVVLPPRNRGAAAASSEDIWDGLTRASGGEYLAITKPPSSVEYIEIIEVEDGPDGASTIRRLKDRTRTHDCLLVLGHVESTRAKSCVEDFYRREELPAILLGPTTPSITKDAVDADSHLILRMLPTDDMQVDRIARVVMERPDFERIVIASDTSNEVYSDYITTQLAQNEIVGGRIVWTVPISPTDVSEADFCSVARYNPDLIIVVGMSTTARILVQSWEAVVTERDCTKVHDLKNVSAMFTDGCATKQFHEFIVGRDSEKWKDLFILSPMPRRGTSEQGELFDYELLGEFASHLSSHLLNKAYQQGRLNRAGVVEQVNVLMKDGRTHIGPRDGKTYVDFTPDSNSRNVMGDNQEWKWNVYQVNRSRKRMELFE